MESSLFEILKARRLSAFLQHPEMVCYFKPAWTRFGGGRIMHLRAKIQHQTGNQGQACLAVSSSQSMADCGSGCL